MELTYYVYGVKNMVVKKWEKKVECDSVGNIIFWFVI